jgi:hypothetical protein
MEQELRELLGSREQRRLTPVEQELLALVEQKRRDNPKLAYHEALKLVAAERPDVDERYTTVTRGLMLGRA